MPTSLHGGSMWSDHVQEWVSKLKREGATDISFRKALQDPGLRERIVASYEIKRTQKLKENFVDLKHVIRKGDVSTVLLRVDDLPVIECKMGKNALHIVSKTGTNETNNKCISMVFYDDMIELVNYYQFPLDREACPKIDHAHFFQFVDFLSWVFKCKVVLDDHSSKALTSNCKLHQTVMSLLKGRTFYNRYGFKNDNYAWMIAESDHRSAFREKTALYTACEKYKLATTERYSDLLRKLGDRSATNRHIATLFYELCTDETNTAFLNDEEIAQIYKRFRKHLEEQYRLKGAEFERPASKVKYAYKMDKTPLPDRFILTVRSPGARKRYSRSSARSMRAPIRSPESARTPESARSMRAAIRSPGTKSPQRGYFTF